MYNWLTVANAITGSRLVFFALFIWAAQIQAVGWAVILFALAWGLDAIDGYAARKFNQATRFGYIFDKVVDRMVLFCGLVILLINKLVPDYALLILTKDIAALPAVTTQIYATKAMPSMGRMGKVVTLAQGVTVGWVLLDAPGAFLVVLMVAIMGAIVSGRFLLLVYYREKKR